MSKAVKAKAKAKKSEWRKATVEGDVLVFRKSGRGHITLDFYYDRDGSAYSWLKKGACVNLDVCLQDGKGTGELQFKALDIVLTGDTYNA